MLAKPEPITLSSLLLSQVINTVKVAQRLWAGTLTMGMLKLGAGYGVIAVSKKALDS